MTGHWAEQAFVEGEVPFSGGSSNGGFWSRKVEIALSFNGELTDTLSAIILKYNVNFRTSIVGPDCFWAGQSLESQRNPF